MNSFTRIAVVTGANKGIGLATVKALCQQFDGIVYLTARDVGRGQAAVEDLSKQGLTAKFHQLDITDEGSIIKLRDYLKAEHGGLDVLINNAGMAYGFKSTVPFAEQAENTINVNFTSTLNVCKLLFPLLRPHSRVVNVSSTLGLVKGLPAGEVRDKFASEALTLDELIKLTQDFVTSAKAGTQVQDGFGNSTYKVSKVALSALTRIQHKESLKDSRPDIVINHVDPGYVDTDMSNHNGILTPEQGAVSSVYAALLPPGTEKPRGDFLSEKCEIRDWVNEEFKLSF